jgi:hypothetical protein
MEDRDELYHYILLRNTNGLLAVFRANLDGKLRRVKRPQHLRTDIGKSMEQLYITLCDVIERAWQHRPVDSYKDDPVWHTSDYARAGANRLVEVLHALGVEVER